MLVTISIALVACSILGYYMANYRKQAIDYKVKYQASRSFSDEAATRIIKLEYDNASLAETVRSLKSTLTLAEARSQAKSTPASAPKMNANSTQKPNKRGRKPKQVQN